MHLCSPASRSSTDMLTSVSALAFTYEAALLSYVLPVAILFTIDADIGPSGQINWIATAWSLATAVVQTIAGRCSDIFGRRNFTIAGNLFGLIGTSTHVPGLLSSTRNLSGAGCAVACRYNLIYTSGHIARINNGSLQSHFRQYGHRGNCLNGRLSHPPNDTN